MISGRQTDRQRQRQTEADRQTDRRTDRRTHTDKDRQRQTEAERDRNIYTERERFFLKYLERQRQRQTDRQAGRQTGRDRQTDRQTEAQTDRDTDRERDTDRGRDREKICRHRHPGRQAGKQPVGHFSERRSRGYREKPFWNETQGKKSIPSTLKPVFVYGHCGMSRGTATPELVSSLSRCAVSQNKREESPSLK